MGDEISKLKIATEFSKQDLEDELDDIKRKSRKPKMDEDEAAAMVNIFSCYNLLRKVLQPPLLKIHSIKGPGWNGINQFLLDSQKIEVFL